MTQKVTGRNQKQINLSRDHFRALQAQGVVFQPATLSQTMGPLWQHIYYLPMPGNTKRPYYSPSHSPAEIQTMVSVHLNLDDLGI